MEWGERGKAGRAVRSCHLTSSVGSTRAECLGAARGEEKCFFEESTSRFMSRVERHSVWLGGLSMSLHKSKRLE